MVKQGVAMNKSKVLAELGILTAIALVLSFVESQIPAFFPIPGIKLGLTNIVVIIALYDIDNKGAAFINFMRIILVSMVAGNSVSLIYSLAGGLLSLVIMIILKESKRFNIIVVSIAGGVSHNVGQIIIAMILLNTREIGWYLLILWFTGIASGALVGLLGNEIIKRIQVYDKSNFY